MGAGSSSSRRWALLGAALVLALVIAYLAWPGEEPEADTEVAAGPTDTAPAPGPIPDTPPLPAPVDGGTAAPEGVVDLRQNKGHSVVRRVLYPDGSVPEGLPPGDPGRQTAVGEAPENLPTLEEGSPEPEDTTPPDREWKISKRQVLLESMDARVSRLEQRIRDAEAAGDTDRAHRDRLILQRTQSHMERIHQEIEDLRTQPDEPEPQEDTHAHEGESETAPRGPSPGAPPP